MLYEHQNNITTLKADGELALKLQQDEFRVNEGGLGKDKRNLKQELKEQELANQDTIRALKLEHSKEITKLRQEFELQAKELQQKYEVSGCGEVGRRRAYLLALQYSRVTRFYSFEPSPYGYAECVPLWLSVSPTASAPSLPTEKDEDAEGRPGAPT